MSEHSSISSEHDVGTWFFLCRKKLFLVFFCQCSNPFSVGLFGIFHFFSWQIVLGQIAGLCLEDLKCPIVFLFPVVRAIGRSSILVDASQIPVSFLILTSLGWIKWCSFQAQSLELGGSLYQHHLFVVFFVPTFCHFSLNYFSIRCIQYTMYAIHVYASHLGACVTPLLVSIWTFDSCLCSCVMLTLILLAMVLRMINLYYLIRLCQVIVLDRRLCSLYLHVRQDSGPVLSKHEQWWLGVNVCNWGLNILNDLAWSDYFVCDSYFIFVQSSFFEFTFQLVVSQPCSSLLEFYIVNTVHWKLLPISHPFKDSVDTFRWILR